MSEQEVEIYNVVFKPSAYLEKFVVNLGVDDVVGVPDCAVTIEIPNEVKMSAEVINALEEGAIEECITAFAEQFQKVVKRYSQGNGGLSGQYGDRATH